MNSRPGTAAGRVCLLLITPAVGSGHLGQQHYLHAALSMIDAQGGYLRKYGRYGKPKQHWFRLSHDDKELLWDSSNVRLLWGTGLWAV